jgi:hypothetical protein
MKHKLFKKNLVTDEEMAVLEDFNSGFSEAFSAAVEKLFDPKEGKAFPFRYEDMLQYFPVREKGEYEHSNLKLVESENKLDDSIKAAMAATAYEWLAKQGRMAMGQTTQSIHQMMNLDKDEEVPVAASRILLNTGTSAEAMAASIGKVILDRINITDTKQSDATAKKRMEMSLGYMVIAALEDMKRVKRQDIIIKYGDSDNTELIGLEALRAGQELEESEVIYDGTEDGKAGKVTLTLVQLRHVVNENNVHIIPKYLEHIEDTFKAGPKAFDKLFANEPQTPGIHWAEPDLPEKMRIGRSKIHANDEQTRNIKKYSNIEYERSAPTMDLLKKINGAINYEDPNDPITALLMEILGAETYDNKLNIHHKNVEGVQRGIKNEFRQAMEYEELADDRKKNNQSIGIYIPSDFMANMRMLQRGGINPQNAKMHRSLFSPVGWKVSFQKGDPKLDQAFHEAIAFAFDIESGKVGGHENQRIKLDEMLKDPAIKAALDVLSSYHKDGEMTLNRLRTLAAGVAVTENKVHGLKGLIEYARYRDHNNADGDFTTDVHKEIDGVSNGPIIGILQLIPDSADKQAVLASLAMGGISTKAQVNLDNLLNQYNLNDAYQRMGQQWALRVALLKQELDTTEGKGKNKAQRRLRQANALTEILGSFTDPDQPGVINNTIRKLSKPRTMQTIYGAGKTRQIEILTGSDVIHDGIYKQMEDIITKVNNNAAHDPTKAELQTLLDNVDTLTGDTTNINWYMKNGELDEDKLKTYYLNAEQTKKINKAVNATYGMAMKKAIDSTYSSVIAARKPLNDTVQLSVTIYNTILKAKVDALAKEKNSDVITNEELDKILNNIKHLIPKIKTPLHIETDPSYMQIATIGKNKNFAKRAIVSQAYATDMELNKGYPEGIPYLDEVGMSPMVKSIQMLDSMVANHLMSLDTHILNNHDGFSHGIDTSDEIQQEVNQRFREIMTDYSLGDAFVEMNTELIIDGRKALAEENISAEDLLNGTAVKGSGSNDLVGGLIKNNVITLDVIKEINSLPNDHIETSIAEIREESDLDYLDAVQVFIKNEIKASTYKGDMLIEKIYETINNNATEMADQVTANKKIVTDSVKVWAQYPNNGEGIAVTPENSDQIIFGDVDVDTVLNIDATAANETIQTMQDLMDMNYMASSEEGASTSVYDYPDAQQIDSQNVTQVLHSIIGLDDQAKHASIQNSTEHIEHLTRVLNDIVKKVMKPVELFRAEHKLDGKETVGIWQQNPDGTDRKIWIQTQKLSKHPQPGMLGQGIRMSAAEVYAHELIHHITFNGLKDTHLHKQAYALYTLADDELTKKYNGEGFRAFMSDPTSTDGFEILAAKERWDYIFTPKRREDGRHFGLDEFIAFGMTNENFKKELAGLIIDDRTLRAKKALSGIFEKNIQQTLVNLFSRIMDFVNQTFRKQQHSTRMDQELENLVLSLGQVEGRHKTALWKATMDAEGKAAAMGVNLDEKIKSTVVKTMSKTKLGRVITNVKKLPELDNMLSHQMRVLLNWYTDKEQGVIASVITEMKGTTERLKPMHTLLQHRKRVIDAAKNEAATVMKDVVNDWFKRELESTEKVAITKAGLKTDLSSLKDRSTPRAIIGFFTDSKQREDRIEYLLGQIDNDPELKPFRTFFKNAADDLGYYMITSKGRVEGEPMMNAHNIALMKMTQGEDALQGPAFHNAVELIEQLATLSSLRYVEVKHKTALASLMEEDYESIENVMIHHNVLKHEALHSQFSGNPALMQKGYTRQILNARIQFEQGTKADEVRYTAAGYHMQATPIERDPRDPVQEDIYMFKSVLGTVNDLQPGIASYTRNAQKGTSPYDLQRQTGSTVIAPQQADINNRKMLAETQRRLNGMFKVRKNRILARSGSANYMVPKFDLNGNIVQKRYVMAEHTKDGVLQQHSEFDAVLASMSSQIVDKKYSPEINSDLVVALKDFHDSAEHGITNNAAEYVEISANAKHQRYRDIWHQLPDKTKQQINSVWGGPSMLVPLDVVDLAFGQRKQSIVDMFGKDQKSRNTFERIIMYGLTLAMGANNPFVDPPEKCILNPKVSLQK